MLLSDDCLIAEIPGLGQGLIVGFRTNNSNQNGNRLTIVSRKSHLIIVSIRRLVYPQVNNSLRGPEWA